MHNDEDLNCKVLSVMMRQSNVLKYIFFNRISLDLYHSRLAATSLTVITEMFLL